MPDAPLAIARRADVGMVTLRADFAAAGLAEAVAAAAGAPLPQPRRIAFGDAGAVAWMAPDELMLFVGAGEAPDRVAALAAALAGTHHLVVDVSSARAVFRLQGPHARATLAAGAPVDLAPGAFGAGDFRRTRLGQVAAAIWSTGPDAFELMCFRSVADHVALWLGTAAKTGGDPALLTPAPHSDL